MKKITAAVFFGALIYLERQFSCPARTIFSPEERPSKKNYLRPVFLRPTASYRIGRKKIVRENVRDAPDHIESRFLSLKSVWNGLLAAAIWPAFKAAKDKAVPPTLSSL
jgi:hypothetical protein